MWNTDELGYQTFATKMEYEQIQSIIVKYYNPTTNKHIIIEHSNFENIRNKEHTIQEKTRLIEDRNGNPIFPIPNGMELKLNIDCNRYTTTIKEAED
jgi:hypothetical protein